jgi:hypothetical protein
MVSFRARLSYGNPHAPFGIGAYTVTVGVDDNVELVHERGGKRRRWIAHARSGTLEMPAGNAHS